MAPKTTSSCIQLFLRFYSDSTAEVKTGKWERECRRWESNCWGLTASVQGGIISTNWATGLPSIQFSSIKKKILTHSLSLNSSLSQSGTNRHDTQFFTLHMTWGCRYWSNPWTCDCIYMGTLRTQTAYREFGTLLMVPLRQNVKKKYRLNHRAKDVAYR